MQFFLFLVAIVSIFGSTGCSLLAPHRSQRSAITRDVPHAARPPGDMALRQRILVLPFIDEKVGSTNPVLEESRRAVVRLLQQTGEFVLIDPSDFPEDPKKFMTPTGDYNMEEIARIAAGMGLAAVLEGKILEIRARKVGEPVGIIREIKANVESKVRIRVVAARNGREILNEVRQANAESSTTRVMERGFSDRDLRDNPQLVRVSVRKAFLASIPQIAKAVNKLRWEGRVALVNGEKVFINAGRLSGIQVGDILKITEEGEEIFDPETGRFIGTAPGRMKGTVEIISYFGKDGAIGIVHSGSGFKENDRVELY